VVEGLADLDRQADQQQQNALEQEDEDQRRRPPGQAARRQSSEQRRVAFVHALATPADEQVAAQPQRPGETQTRQQGLAGRVTVRDPPIHHSHQSHVEGPEGVDEADVAQTQGHAPQEEHDHQDDARVQGQKLGKCHVVPRSPSCGRRLTAI
jgi:hypothetical protein